MNSVIHIETSQTNGFYVLLYLLTFVLVYFRLIWVGYKTSLSLVHWITAIGLCYAGFSIGSRIMFMDTVDWLNLSGGRIPEIQGRSVIGGMFGALSGIIIGKYLLKIPVKAIDQYALLLPLGIAVTRVGCFLSGCCYGKVSTVSWTVTYGDSSTAFMNHAAHHLVPMHQISSLGVHPVQLYEVIGCCILFYILYRVQLKFKEPFNLILFSGSLYGLLRFITEFFRDAQAHVTENSTWFVNGVQGFLLILVPVLWLIIFWREGHFKRIQSLNYFFSLRHKGVKNHVEEIPASNYVLFFTLSGLTVICSLMSVALTPLDFLVINLALVPAWIFFLVHVYKQSYIFSRHPMIALLIFGALFSMAQTEGTTDDQPDKKSFNTINVGIFHGSHDLTDVYTYGGDCDNVGPTITSTFNEKYTAGGAGFSRTVIKDEFKRITFGMDAMVGTWNEKGSDNLATDRSVTYYDANPYVKFDDKVVGIGIGLHIGDLPIFNDSYNQGEVTLMTRYRVYPQFNFRLGRRDKFFGEIHFADAGYGSFPGSVLQIALGSGFGHQEKHSLQVGTSSFSAFYIAPSFLVAKHYYINPYFGTGTSIFNDFTTESNTQTGLRLSYRF